MDKNSPPKIYGLIGYPVKHSFSPAMHNAAFEHLKKTGVIDYDAKYSLFEVKPEELEGFLLAPSKQFKDEKGIDVFAGEVCGFNITIPHKVRAREILSKEFPIDRSSPKNLQILETLDLSGAVNTVKREGGKLYYCNTDTRGFSKSLKEDLKFDTKDRCILIFGCGGAGRAIVAGLGWRGIKEVRNIYIYEINKNVAISASKHFSKITYLNGRLEFISDKKIPQVIKKCQLLVNASSVGMKDGDGSVVDKSLLHGGLSVYDAVYNRETQLIKDAKSKGLSAVAGERMLLYQGMFSFKIWTGKDAPQEVMWQALQGELKNAKNIN